MNCSKCDAITEVIESKRFPDQVRRRRQCKSCGARFTTYEVYGDQYKAIKKVRQGKADTWLFKI